MKRRLGLLLLIVSTVIGLGSVANADTIVRGFKSHGTLQPGIVVALDKSGSDTVTPASADQLEEIYGVVIDPNKAPATIRQTGEQVFVASTGVYPVLVSAQAGNISPGDYISLSSTNGIGAKASDKQSTVLGRALEAFDGKTGAITTGADGSAIGQVAVNIVPGKNPLAKGDVAIPQPLKRIGEAIAGKNVSAIRIYASFAVFTITAIIAMGVLWIGIKSGMIAIGRNPLSRNSIIKSLIQVVSVAVLVFAIGLFAVYLLLKL